MTKLELIVLRIKVFLAIISIFLLIKARNLIEDYFKTSLDKNYIEQDIYRIKPYFFSQSENKFYRLISSFLFKEFKWQYRVFPHVRLIDVLIMNKHSPNKRKYMNKVMSKHIDYLIVDRSKDFRPVMAIELDWNTHSSEKTFENDEFKKKVINSVGMKFLTFCNQEIDNKESIFEKIKNKLIDK